MPRHFSAAFLLLLSSLPVIAAPRTVVTILPAHSLVAGVMEGVGEPDLLLPPGASPHSYALLPSDARTLTQADLIVWVGAGLEQFLQKPLQTLASRASRLELASVPGLSLLATSTTDAHHHGDGTAADTGHQHDPHLWLDPLNAIRIIEAVAQQLAKLDPDNATTYQHNAERRKAQLLALDAELQSLLEPVRTVPFLVFHDAYRYFEQRYGLSKVGALTLNPERPPGARTVAAARERVRELGIRCVFREPQFEPTLAETVVRGTTARIGVLDPIGVDVPPGPDAYARLLRNLGDSLVSCLSR